MTMMHSDTFGNQMPQDVLHSCGLDELGKKMSKSANNGA